MTLKFGLANILNENTGNVSGNVSTTMFGVYIVTIKDIAKACGVGVSTVSRVLNNKPDVSEAVREKVLEFVEKSGYIPNNSARDLVKSSSDAIGVIVRGMGNLFFSSILKTVSTEIDKSDYTMVLHFIDSGEDEVKAGAVLEREKKLRGLIFLGGRYDYSPEELSIIGVPYVCCSYSNSFGTLDEKSYSSVTIDDYLTAYNAVKHLINLGHRRIAALVPACCDRSVSQLRFNGYKAALKDSGIEFDESLVMETGGIYGLNEAYEGTKALIERDAAFTALFTASDSTAIAAMKALEEKGRRVPDDCSVIAIDGLNISHYVSPTLTTMVQPADEMGRECVKILLDILEGWGENRHVRLETALREGGSVKSI